ncbi:MAG: trigger factor [Halieaceae bacterium]|jgi:trigger factor
MQVSIETTSGLERRLTVGVPAERVDQEVDSRLKKAAKNVRLDGFRPGKVPFKVVRQRYGAGIRQEVVGEVMSQSFYEAVTQENLKPAGQPSIEPRQMEEGRDLQYIATFEVFPDIELAEMNGIVLERTNAEVTDADIDGMIEIFRKQQGGWETAERAAQDGDKVNIDYAGTKEGEAFDGGSAEGSDLELGSNRMIPGFEDGIVGMKAGDEKVLELSFPEDYHSEDLKGAAVEFKITLNRVEEQVLAPLDEELFKQYGVEDGGEDKFRQDIAENMARELSSAIKSNIKSQVMDGVLAAHENLDVPKALIGQEIGNMRKQMFQQFSGGQQQPDLDLDSLLPAEMFEEQATKRVKLGLLLNEIISHRELKADPDKVRSTIEEMASTYEKPEEVINYYYGNQEQLSSIESMVLEEAIVDSLVADAAVTELTCDYQEALSRARSEA